MKATLYENKYVDDIHLERFKAYDVVGIAVSVLVYLYVHGAEDDDDEDNGYDRETYIKMSFDIYPGAEIPTSLLKQLGVTLDHEDVNLLDIAESILDSEMEIGYSLSDIESQFDIEEVTIIADGKEVTILAYCVDISDYAISAERAICE